MGSKEHLKVEPPLSLPRCGVSALHGVIAEWPRADPVQRRAAADGAEKDATIN